jgi:hypothetical protein
LAPAVTLGKFIATHNDRRFLGGRFLVGQSLSVQYPDPKYFVDCDEYTNAEIKCSRRFRGRCGWQWYATTLGHNNQLAVLFDDPISNRAMKHRNHQTH